MKINIQASDFPAASKSTYLNTASVALMYQGCQRAIDEWNTDLAENGTMNFDEHAEQTIFDPMHSAFAKLLGANPTDIAVASSATEQLASLAWAIMPEKGSKILSSGIVFPTTVYPFARVARHTGARVEFVQGERGYLDPQKLLEQIDDQTSVVCLSHVEFGSGQRYDIKTFADTCHEHGALLIVDATQSAGAVPINAPECGADAIICAGYKWLCGPFGASVMYVAPELQSSLDPGLVGFRSNKDIWNLELDQQEYPDTAHRFEFSTMAYGCAVGLAESVNYLHNLGIDNIFSHNLTLADRVIASLEELGGEVFSPKNNEERTSIVSARFPKIESKSIVEGLSERNIIISPRRDFFRFSPHCYNTLEDIDIAMEGIKQVVCG
jgi:cysteine desulfurase/selenocysteine lyase